jgi:hypothetical protein
MLTNNLGVAYRDAGRFAEAEPLLVEAVTRARLVFKLQHPNAQGYLLNLADCYSRMKAPGLLGASFLAQKRYAEAESVLLAGYAGLKARESAIPSKARGG